MLKVSGAHRYSKEHLCHTYVNQENLQDICELNLVGYDQSRQPVMLKTLCLVVGETDGTQVWSIGYPLMYSSF